MRLDVSISLTVVLPVYNAEKYVAEAITSILKQTYTQFEFLIINDGSTDKSLQVIQNTIGNDPRVKLVSRENKGLSFTLNEAAQIASGDYYARMDADDIALPNRLEKQIKFIEKHKVDICGTWHQLFGAQTNVIVFPETEDDIRCGLLFNSPFSHPTVILKTELIKKLGYRTEFNGAEDYDLWERALRAGYRAYNIPEVLYFYRIHPEQVSSASYTRQRELGHIIRKRSVDSVADYFELSPSDLDVLLLPRERTLSRSEIIKLVDVSSNLANILPSSDVLYERVTHLLYMSAGKNWYSIVAWFSFSKQLRKKVLNEKLFVFLVIILFRVRYETPRFYRLQKFFYRLKK